MNLIGPNSIRSKIANLTCPRKDDISYFMGWEAALRSAGDILANSNSTLLDENEQLKRVIKQLLFYKEQWEGSRQFQESDIVINGMPVKEYLSLIDSIGANH